MPAVQSPQSASASSNSCSLKGSFKNVIPPASERLFKFIRHEGKAEDHLGLPRNGLRFFSQLSAAPPGTLLFGCLSKIASRDNFKAPFEMSFRETSARCSWSTFNIPMEITRFNI
jgi:hypothetical protein